MCIHLFFSLICALFFWWNNMENIQKMATKRKSNIFKKYWLDQLLKKNKSSLQRFSSPDVLSSLFAAIDKNQIKLTRHLKHQDPLQWQQKPRILNNLQKLNQLASLSEDSQKDWELKMEIYNLWSTSKPSKI